MVDAENICLEASARSPIGSFEMLQAGNDSHLYNVPPAIQCHPQPSICSRAAARGSGHIPHCPWHFD